MAHREVESATTPSTSKSRDFIFIKCSFSFKIIKLLFETNKQKQQNNNKVTKTIFTTKSKQLNK